MLYPALERKLRARNDYRERLLIMKLAIRIFALSVVFAGLAAASLSSSTPKTFKSRQSATATMPIPWCAPGIPTCPDGNTPPPSR